MTSTGRPKGPARKQWLMRCYWCGWMFTSSRIDATACSPRCRQGIKRHRDHPELYPRPGLFRSEYRQGPLLYVPSRHDELLKKEAVARQYGLTPEQGAEPR